MFRCPECDFSIDSFNSLRIHASKKHNLSSENLYIQVVLNGNVPTCKCGCGHKTKFHGPLKGFSEYLLGHSAKINNNWGHNKDAFEKSLTTRRKMWESGEIQGWCKGLTKDDPRIAAIVEKMNTPERAQKISNSLTGKPKTAHHKEKISKHMKEYWGDETNRARQSFEQAERVKNGLLTKCTRVHGYFDNPKKSCNERVYYRSLFELNAILYLESNEAVLSYKIEPYQIEYSFMGKKRNYVVDCLVEYRNGKKVIVEFKPNCHLKNDKNVAKFESAKIFAEKMGYEFEVWTEKTHDFLTNAAVTHQHVGDAE